MLRKALTASVGILLFGCSFTRPNIALSVNAGDLMREVERLDCDELKRAERSRELFVEYGASPSEEEFTEPTEVVNIVSKLPGRSNETIIVGAHYDKTSRGCGAIDNWAGVVILANLFRELSRGQNEKSFVFVAFGGEEKGLIGSKAMARAIPSHERSSICAMVNFDSMGIDDPWALEDISDPGLIELAESSAKKAGTPFSTRSLTGASSDSKPFGEIGIPAITFSGLGKNWKEHLHNENDRPENIKSEKLIRTFRFAYEFLKDADAGGCREIPAG